MCCGISLSISGYCRPLISAGPYSRGLEEAEPPTQLTLIPNMASRHIIHLSFTLFLYVKNSIKSSAFHYRDLKAWFSISVKTSFQKLTRKELSFKHTCLLLGLSQDSMDFWGFVPPSYNQFGISSLFQCPFIGCLLYQALYQPLYPRGSQSLEKKNVS